ncbi:MAG TPA: FHA domain-containing protein [Steroidobacteraceae bacterium]|nr:FHA domain-containing protein [Steroidobacteraceae bacterium]
MEPNPIKRIIQWLFPSAGEQSANAGAGRRCEAGHAMDPSWTRCPYCEALKNARDQSPRPRTRLDHPEDPESPERADGRRLTGVLVTFSWRREGELFPLFEGKNLIGSGGTAADRRCDVRITKDSTLSREHALIRCLGDGYEIFDQKSENGTFMDDEPVPVHGMPLPDRSRIKTGATVWTFISIKSPAREKRTRGDEGFRAADRAIDEEESADQPIAEAQPSPETPRANRRPTTVPDLEEKPRDPRRPTTFFRPVDPDDERESGAAGTPDPSDVSLRRGGPHERTPAKPEEESSRRTPKDKASEPAEPAKRGRDDRTKFF